MDAKPALIAAGIVAVGIAGYFANEWRVCNNLRADYRSFAIGLMADGQMRSVIQSPEFDKMMKQKTDTAIQEAADTLFELGERCGKSAATQAQADAQALVLGVDKF